MDPNACRNAHQYFHRGGVPGTRLGPAARQSVVSRSMNLRNHLLATGRFLTVFSASMLRFNAKAWSLKALPIDLRVPHRRVAIITLKGRTLSPVVKLFIDQARAAGRRASSPANLGIVRPRLRPYSRRLSVPTAAVQARRPVEGDQRLATMTFMAGVEGRSDNLPIPIVPAACDGAGGERGVRAGCGGARAGHGRPGPARAARPPGNSSPD
jgi:hypothetical protein